MSMFMAAESIRRGEKDPLSWIVEEVMVSQIEEKGKEAMTPKRLSLVEPQKRWLNLSRSQQGLRGKNTRRLKGRRRWQRDCCGRKHHIRARMLRCQGESKEPFGEK